MTTKKTGNAVTVAAAEKVTKKTKKKKAVRRIPRRRRGFLWSREMSDHLDRACTSRQILKTLVRVGICHVPTIEKVISAYLFEENSRRPPPAPPSGCSPSRARYRRGYEGRLEDRLFEECLDTSLLFLSEIKTSLQHDADDAAIGQLVREAWDEAHRFALFIEADRPVESESAL